ncbi:MAG TPA: hypothetical protein VLL95_14600 [Phnomibacter sp.]|nr:hypothetical protein [Phnomibacter sp.]
MKCFRYLLSVLLLSSVGLTYSQQGILGQWKGSLIETGRSGPYKVSITFRTSASGVLEGTIWYEDYGCGGMLKYMETVGEKIVFREKLYSADKCIDNGQAAFTLQGEALFMIWRHAEQRYQAEGKLRRY